MAAAPRLSIYLFLRQCGVYDAAQHCIAVRVRVAAVASIPPEQVVIGEASWVDLTLAPWHTGKRPAHATENLHAPCGPVQHEDCQSQNESNAHRTHNQQSINLIQR